jgi:uncharacterized protein YbaR (Trm112 family)
VSQVVACPNCEKKLTVKDELKGRTLVCPQCKGRFTLAVEQSVGIGEGWDTAAETTLLSTGSDMTFLDKLSPAAAKLDARTSPSRGRAKTSRGISLSAHSAGSRGRKKNQQLMLLYVGGGVAAAVVLVVVFLAAMSSGEPSVHRKEKVGENRFGMTESTRKCLFKDLFHAVDEYGIGKPCRAAWQRLGREQNLSDQQISAVLQEGLDQGWEQPEMVATMDQKQKTNRQEWIRVMNETKREPIMAH